MAPLSVDFRSRVVAAVRQAGMSRRDAAERFGVSVASAIRRGGFAGTRKLRALADGWGTHKSPRVLEILAKKNCAVRSLPPYSPDLNRIEKAYFKLKAFLRKLAERTVAA